MNHDACFNEIFGSDDALFGEIFGLPEQEYKDLSFPRLNKNKNITSVWLEQRIRETGGNHGSFLQGIRSSLAKSLPISARSAMIEDHLNNFILKLIRNDSLRERIENQIKITDGQLRLFAVRSGHTDTRKTATEPVDRELYSSRTDRERTRGVHISQNYAANFSVIRSQDTDNPGVLDYADSSSPTPEDEAAFNEAWQMLEKQIKEVKPNASSRYIRILRMKVDGLTVDEIALAESVTTFRASSILAELRRSLRDGDVLRQIFNRDI